MAGTMNACEMSAKASAFAERVARELNPDARDTTGASVTEILDVMRHPTEADGRYTDDYKIAYERAIGALLAIHGAPEGSAHSKTSYLNSEIVKLAREEGDK